MGQGKLDGIRTSLCWGASGCVCFRAPALWGNNATIYSALLCDRTECGWIMCSQGLKAAGSWVQVFGNAHCWERIHYVSSLGELPASSGCLWMLLHHWALLEVVRMEKFYFSFHSKVWHQCLLWLWAEVCMCIAPWAGFWSYLCSCKTAVLFHLC